MHLSKNKSLATILNNTYRKFYMGTIELLSAAKGRTFIRVLGSTLSLVLKVHDLFIVVVVVVVVIVFWEFFAHINT